MDRLASLSSQLIAGKAKDPNDVVICSAVRTPLTKAKRGGLKDTQPDTLLTAVFSGAVERAKCCPKKVQDICVGNNLMVGAGEIHFRMAQLMAGIPDSTPIMAVNRLCSSGLESCATIAAKIKAGTIDCGLGAGIECMSLYDMNASVNTERISDSVFDNETARKCLMGMGETSENVAEKYGVTREQQDRMAVESHQKAYKAQKAGLFKGKKST
jgi:acetyl-CoA acyltransferase 1